MKLKIKEICRDGQTGETYSVGQVIDVSDARGAEILAAADGFYAEEVVKKATAKKKPADTEDVESDGKDK